MTTIQAESKVNHLGIGTTAHGVLTMMYGALTLLSAATLNLIPVSPFSGEFLTSVTIFYIVFGTALGLSGVAQVAAGVLLLKRHPQARRVATGAYTLAILPSFTLWCTPTSVALIIWGLLTLRRDDVQALLNPDTDDAPEA